jgi:hypothetical protein
MKREVVLGLLLSLSLLPGCTQESQNQLGRALRNWTGNNGVLDIYAGDKLVMRFIEIDKLSTAYGTSDGTPRAYRYGFGVIDLNRNFRRDPDEKKIYFEIGELSNNYVFYESYR